MKVGDLANRRVLSVAPGHTLREAAQAMIGRRVGSAVVMNGDERLVGIFTERDVLRAIGGGADVDATRVEDHMTRDVVTIGPDWEVYEAAAEMAARQIRHLVVSQDERVLGMLSVRDLLVSGQRVELTEGEWAVLRDPVTFTVRERRKLQRVLLQLRGAGGEEVDMDDLIGVVLGSWSFDIALPPDAEALRGLSAKDYERLREAVLDELPDLQRSVHPAPGWRRRDERR